tara:strand:+ start:113 stop:496 length:384 start_codon:yes stop_codon:yes gene_type:complete
MEIREYKIEQIREFACDLLSKTYLQLGQRPNEEDIYQMSMVLAEDLQEDFDSLTFMDIEKSFRDGIRNTDDFHLSVKVYYKWIKSFRQIIWNNEKIEPQMQDKRLKYRSRQGTGLKQIDIKKIKLLK